MQHWMSFIQNRESVVHSTNLTSLNFSHTSRNLIIITEPQPYIAKPQSYFSEPRAYATEPKSYISKP